VTPKGKDLFPEEIHPSRYGESHRRRNLFLPRDLKAKSSDYRLRGAADKLQKNIADGFKNNDQLKTNTSLQMDAAKIEIKVI